MNLASTWAPCHHEHMGDGRNTSVISRAWGPILAVLLTALPGCAEDAIGPQLLPIPAQSVKVDQTLSLFLPVDNPRGDNLALAFSGPALPSLQSVARVTSTPQGGLFLYTPLASHVGTHQFTFTVFGGGSSHQQLAAITVETPESAAPVFLTPGKGGTYDLGVSSCVKESLEVKDDDTTVVEIRAREALPQGATLTKKGDKRARFEWCPTAEQVNATLTWQLKFEADDGEHAPTPHDYTVVLRPSQGAAGQCPGSPPIITVVSPWAGEMVESPSSFPVIIDVSDDLGVKEPPILYWSDVEPSESASAGEFEQVLFESSGGPTWVAEVPPITVESTTIWFKIAATDNDDPHGTACDHRTETPLISFVAQAPGGSEVKADLCEACSSNEACYSGHCVVGSSGGKCLPDCVPPVVQCTAGACIEATLVDGSTAQVCGDVGVFCEGSTSVTSDCVPDLNEPNDSVQWATVLGDPSATWHTEGANICPTDHDFFVIQSIYDANVVVSVSGFNADADLDFKLVSESGSTIATAATLSAKETVSHCMESGEEVFVDVYAFKAATESPYLIEVQRTEGQCCVNDLSEPDDTQSEAPEVTVGQTWSGTLCSNDTDMRKFTVSSSQSMILDVEVSSSGALPSVSLSILNDAGGLITSTSNVSSSFEMSFFPTSPGTYFAKVTSNSYEPTEFEAAVKAGGPTICYVSKDCPVGTVCDVFSGSCDSSTCYGPDVCPLGTLCDLGQSFSSPGTCVDPCDEDADCRVGQGETCKKMLDGTHCGLAGSGARGDACENHVDCAGAMSCFGWPGGYCTEIGCQSNSDCGAGAFCRTAYSGGTPYGLCVKKCDVTNSTCRADEGYTCVLNVDKSFELKEGCVPSFEEGDWL